MSTSNRDAALGLRIQPQVIRVQARSPEYEKAFEAMKRERAQALVVLEEPINQACRQPPGRGLAAARSRPSVEVREGRLRLTVAIPRTRNHALDNTTKNEIAQVLPARRSFFPGIVPAAGRLSRSAASTPRPCASLSTTSIVAA